MQSATEFVETRRPVGGRRSGKRDLIVRVFLQQEGHLSAEDLVALIRREISRIGSLDNGLFSKKGARCEVSGVRCCRFLHDPRLTPRTS